MPIKRKTKGARAARLSRPPSLPKSIAGSDREAFIAVMQELFQAVTEAMAQSGASPSEQETAFNRARSGKKVIQRPSKSLLGQFHALAELLSHWQRDKHYTDKLGSPKVLPIHGKGASLASLGRIFVPGMPVQELVTAVIRHGEVNRLEGDKVALLGTNLLVPPKTADITLAQLTLGCQRLIRSSLRNAALPEKHKTGAGHLLRFVIGDLTDEQYAEWLQSVRPGLQRSIQEVESGLRVRGKRGKGKTSGVGIFVFRDE